MALQTGEKTLQQIVSTVASSLELTEVLKAVVRLMSEASGVHACFAYVVSEDGERLVLRAASPPYARQAGKVVMERGEGLAWWAAERGEPAFIRDDALADPRTKYFAELEEEKFQSLLALPVIGRSGEAIGVITAHTEAPREFSDDEVDFLVTSASLVAGAIENARLYEEAQARVSELEQLTELAEAIARADALEPLLETVTAGARSLLGARACHVYLLDSGSEELERRASDPEAGNARPRLGLAELRPRARSRRAEHAARHPARRERRAHRPARGRGEPSGRPRPGGGEPGRGRDQEGPGHRAAHREEPHQGLLRGAGRRATAERARREGGAPRLRSRPGARRPGRRAGRRRFRARAPVGRSRLALRPPRGLSACTREAPHRKRRAPSREAAPNPGRASATALGRHLERLPGRDVRGRLRGGSTGALGNGRPARRAGCALVRGPGRLQVPAADRGGRRHPRRDRRRGLARSRRTTPSAARSSSRRSRSSCGATARSARPPRRCTSTRTRCASDCAGWPSSPGSTCAATTGSPSRSP